MERQLPFRAPAVVKGVAFGLVVWLGSYNGWIPALEIMPPSHKDRPRRAGMMLAAHVVYGAVLGWMARDGER